MPKPRDIGLIFDVTLENSDEEVKELLEFSIRSNGYCCVNVTPEVIMEKMGRIVGGDFGFIEPGAIEKVSLIWPTVSLYNRVGLCPIAITSKNSQNEERTIKQMIKFDTRFEILDPESHTLRKQKDFIDCQNWDKDYFKNCTPVACEERYFGRRNFYNVTSEKCEEVPRCTEKYQLYDMFTNECVDNRVICSEEDLKGFREGKFDNNVWEFKRNLKKKPQNPPNDPLNVKPAPEYSNKFAQNYLKRSHLNPFDHGQEEKWLNSKSNENQSSSDWLKGLGKGLLIVFATIAIYLLICFGIFLIVAWLSRRSNNGAGTGVSRRGMILTPRHLGSSEENLPLYTTSSLMSQR